MSNEFRIKLRRYMSNLIMPAGEDHTQVINELVRGKEMVRVSRSGHGVMVNLGRKAPPEADFDPPELYIEPRPGGWAIYVQPYQSADHVAVVYVTKTGETFLQKTAYDPNRELVHFLEVDDRCADIDMPPPASALPESPPTEPRTVILGDQPCPTPSTTKPEEPASPPSASTSATASVASTSGSTSPPSTSDRSAGARRSRTA